VVTPGGTYYPLYADGTTGSAITSITLSSGQGAILLKSLPGGSIPAGAAQPFPASAGSPESAGLALPGAPQSSGPATASANYPADLTLAAALTGAGRDPGARTTTGWVRITPASVGPLSGPDGLAVDWRGGREASALLDPWSNYPPGPQTAPTYKEGFVW